MKKLSFFAILPLLLPNLLVAQGNYVANTTNNSTTATYGTFNTFVGPGAGTSTHVTGNRNIVEGYNSGISLTSGSQNSFYGVDAGEYTTTGSNNTFLGRAAGLSNTTGSNNAFTGFSAGYTNTTGGSNVFSGFQAGYANTTGSQNVFTGYNAGYTNTTGFGNVVSGTYAGYGITSGSFNVFTGNGAGYGNTSGSLNVFTGNSAGLNNTMGGNNVFIGNSAGSNNTTGSNNVFSGNVAGFTNTTGTNNTFMGNQAGYNNTTGSNNIIIGPASGTAITTSDDNVLMGYNSQADDGLQNAIAIGANSRVASSNALILGNGVNVGIGTSAPTNRLQVVSQSPSTSGLTLSNLTGGSPTTRTADQFLTVNETGEVVKARYQLRINSPNEWSDKVFSPTYQLRSLTSVGTYINQYGHLPGVPSAEQVVKEGVDLVKMNATLLEKVEELTLYSIQLEKTNQQLRQKDRKQQREIDELKGLMKLVLQKK